MKRSTSPKKEEESEAEVCGVCGEEAEGESLFCSDEDGEVDQSMEKEIGREWRGEGEEVRKIKVEKEDGVVKELADPRRPSGKEVEKHRGTHVPYWNWCDICVRAKGRDWDHRKEVGKERGLCEYSFDYCFPGDELGYRLTVLVGRERVTGASFATAVPTKGSTGRFTIEKMIEFVEELGDGSQQIVVKTDQEPSIEAVVGDLVKEREEGRTIVEESPKQSSGSNGIVERCVQGIEGHLRVILLEFESRVGEEVDAKEPIVTFMPEYAAYLLNRLEVGKDGKTAYERIKGKVGSVVGVEFGEKVLWKKKKADKQAKIRSRWAHGIFVGVRKRSGEMWVATKAGEIKSVRSVNRIPEEKSSVRIVWVG